MSLGLYPYFHFVNANTSIIFVYDENRNTYAISVFQIIENLVSGRVGITPASSFDAFIFSRSVSIIKVRDFYRSNTAQ